MPDEFISREAAIKYAEHAYHEWNLAMAAADGKREINLVYKRQELCKAVESVFRDMPAADVAEAVRCRDCAAWKRNVGIADSPNGHCFEHDIDTNGQDFCSYGERREEP
jgi:hypothetical protein